jgi:hypothetical protein
VIKGRAVPGSCIVALLASQREAGLHMVRIGCAIEVLHVARGAIRGSSDKLAVDMTLRTGHSHVPAR